MQCIEKDVVPLVMNKRSDSKQRETAILRWGSCLRDSITLGCWLSRGVDMMKTVLRNPFKAKGLKDRFGDTDKMTALVFPSRNGIPPRSIVNSSMNNKAFLRTAGTYESECAVTSCAVSVNNTEWTFSQTNEQLGESTRVARATPALDENSP